MRNNSTVQHVKLKAVNASKKEVPRDMGNSKSVNTTSFGDTSLTIGTFKSKIRTVQMFGGWHNNLKLCSPNWFRLSGLNLVYMFEGHLESIEYSSIYHFTQ